MFTGIIQATGTVLSVKPTTGATRIVVAAPQLAGQWKIGDSIAVNGCCLTALDMEDVFEAHPGRFAADLAAETLARTTLGRLEPGALVNLELPTEAGSRLGGHVVQGHVDGTGRLVSLVPIHPDLDHTDWRMTIELPPELAAGVIPQGSITVDGISLTVARLTEQAGCALVEIAIIPHTYRATNLRALLSGTAVNIETDVLAKYAAKQHGAQIAAAEPVAAAAPPAPVWTPPPPPAPAMHAAKPSAEEWLTAEYLLANGY